MEVFETRLPGVGVRYEFATDAGDRVGVIVRRDGRRELLVYDTDDPDTCRDQVELVPTEAATLGQLLGASQLTERLGELRHEVEGLAIEWLTVPAAGVAAGRTIGDLRLRTETGASVVAVIRGAGSIPGPGPELQLEADDIALVVGTADAVRRAAERLTR